MQSPGALSVPFLSSRVTPEEPACKLLAYSPGAEGGPNALAEEFSNALSPTNYSAQNLAQENAFEINT